MRTTTAIVLVFLLLWFSKAKSQESFVQDTILKDQENLVLTQRVDNFYNYPLVGDNYYKKRVLKWSKQDNQWLPFLDTIFNSSGQTRVVVKHYYFENSHIELVNSFLTSPYSEGKVRFSYFIVVGNVFIVNTFKIVDNEEVTRQYIVSSQPKIVGHGGVHYLDAAYEDFNSNKLAVKEYGITLKLENNTKCIKEIGFTNLFYEKLAPQFMVKFKKISIENQGDFLTIK